MSSSSDAADQVMSMTLKGIEVVAKLSGIGAKNLATYLYAVLNDQKKTRGKTRLVNMLKSGKELKVFSVNTADLKKFTEEAKRYGALFCVLRDKKSVDGMCDVMVRAEDASKINRVIERFKLATVDVAAIKTDIEKAKTEKQAVARDTPAEKSTDAFVDSLMLKSGVKDVPDKEAAHTENPTQQRTKSRPLYGSFSEDSKARVEGFDERSSVREALKEIRRELSSDKSRENIHLNTPPKSKSKKKNKER